MKRSIFILLLAVLTMSVQVLAQGVQPSSARAWSYFPQIANGGHDSSRWVTTFTISNTSEVEVKASIWFQDDDGEPLRLPFGGRSTLQLASPFQRKAPSPIAPMAAVSMETMWSMLDGPSCRPMARSKGWQHTDYGKTTGPGST